MGRKQALIGITGGIASGKSTVSDYLEMRYKFMIFDADRYAREAVQPGSDILQKIIKRYGRAIALSDGSLNRQKLGEIVFSNQRERQWLEKQIHPYVGDRFQDALDRSSDQDILVFSIPLLFEVNMTHLVQEIWVVWCSEQQQLERLMHRNSLTAEQAQERMNSQMSLDQKCQQADRILDNSSTQEALFLQIDEAIASMSL